jgi:hypothetical protein
VHEWSDPLGRRARTGRTRFGYVLRFDGIADYACDIVTREIWCRAVPDADPELVRAFLVGQVMPRLASLEHPPVLHASAVEWGGGALVFAGPAGAGKSTIALALCRTSCRLLADDCTVLKAAGSTFACVPTARGVRVSAAIENSAPSAAERSGATRPAPLDTIFVLDPELPRGDLSISRLPRSEAFLRLLQYSYQIDPLDRVQLAAAFDALSALVRHTRVYSLRMSRDAARLPEIARRILGNRATEPNGA